MSDQHPGKVPAVYSKDVVRARPARARFTTPTPGQLERQRLEQQQQEQRRAYYAWTERHAYETPPWAVDATSPTVRWLGRVYERNGGVFVYGFGTVIILGTLVGLWMLAASVPGVRPAVIIVGIFWLLAFGTHPVMAMARTGRNLIEELTDDD